MEAIAIKRLTEKIKDLPENMIQEISDFVDFLVYRNQKDWYDLLTPEEKQAIEEGLKDIEEGRVISHEKVMEEMRQYIQTKKG
ncbi:MAG: DUF2281 domain-containing protein [Moheibacter sp.]